MPTTPVNILMGPVMLLQGLWVRARTPRLPEAQGLRVGRTGAGPPLSLLVLGDSSAAGVGVATQSQALLGQLTQRLAANHHVRYRLAARTGATTRSTLTALAEMGDAPADVIVTALGVNDLTSGIEIDAWLADQEKLIDGLQAKCRPRLILISGLPPVGRFPALPEPLRGYLGAGARAFDAALAELAQSRGLRFLPLDFKMDPSQMASDGFHPGADIYREWGRRAAAVIGAALGKEAEPCPAS
jgi:lysophospholipase L1-like esterase